MTATKVLLSYARADGAFVRRLYERLTSDGVECFFDEQSLVAAENLVLKISDAIDECNYLVIVMSPAYFAARFAPREWECIFVQDPRNERGRLVPLLLQDCELPALIRVLLHIDVTSTEKFAQIYPRILQVSGRSPPTISSSDPGRSIAGTENWNTSIKRAIFRKK